MNETRGSHDTWLKGAQKEGKTASYLDGIFFWPIHFETQKMSTTTTTYLENDYEMPQQ